MPDFFTPDPSNGRVAAFPETNTNWCGQGSPEGKIPAPIQHTYKDLADGDLWIKNEGDWTKTGWAQWSPS